MTSPGLFMPPVSSRSRSQAVQPFPVQASQISGGQSGRTPTPDTRQSMRTTTAQDGTAFDRPTSSASPGCGLLVKHSNSPPALHRGACDR